MNLANDLLRKSTGYIHEMPKPKAAGVIMSENPSKYLDENGNPAKQWDIALKYGVSHSKVKFLFDRHEYQKVYRLINLDGRAGNGQRGVYHYPDGSDASYDKLAKFYGISTATIQKAWRDNGKDSAKANQHLTARHLTSHSKV
jgi:hypothetical protein